MTDARQQVLLTIDTTPDSVDPLTLTLVLDRPVRRGQPISGRFVASGGSGGYVYDVDGHFPLPDGVSMPDAATGELSGSPTTVTRYEVHASAQDSDSTEADASFLIDVLTSLHLPPKHSVRIGEQGIAYRHVLVVLGATGTLSYSLASGNFPDGLDFDTDGTLTWVGGTPTALGVGFSYATVTALDSGSGDTLDINLVFEIRAAIQDLSPGDPIEVIAGLQTDVPLAPLFSGGVGPYTLTALGTLPDGMGLTRDRTGNWHLAGVPERSFSGEDELWSPVGFDIVDALGGMGTIVFQVLVHNPVNTIFAQKDGVPIGSAGTTPIIDFTGTAVKSVVRAFDGSKFTFTIEPQASGCSVLGCNTTTGGDAVSIAAPTNDRVLARVSNVLQWTQVSMAMVNATGTANNQAFLRGDGVWTKVTVSQMSASGTPGATTFFRGDGSWAGVGVTAITASGTATNATVLRGDGAWANGVTGSWSVSSITVSGLQIVGARVTGFAAATGTADKTTYATYAAVSIGAAYNATVQSQLQAMSNHIQVLSQQVKALKDAALSHGLIGT